MRSITFGLMAVVMICWAGQVLAAAAGNGAPATTRAADPFEPMRDWYFRGRPIPQAGSEASTRMAQYYADHADEADAMYWAAMCQSWGVFRTNRTTFGLLTAAVEKGHTSAMARVGLAYLVGDNVPADPERGLRLVRASHDQGDSDGTMQLGRAYLYGTGVAVDLAAAEEYLRKAVAQGNMRAHAMLGDALARGGEPRKAVDEFVRSAEAGDEIGMEYLGEIYRDGKHGVAPNPAQAISWIKKAAEHGNVVARREMAKMVHIGYGGLAQNENNWATARRLLELAANAGDVPSLRIQAGLYLSGQKGYSLQPQKGLDLLRSAVAAGDAEGMFQLGALYVEGIEVPRDLKRAGELFEQAAGKGFEPARAYLRRLRATTQPAT